MNLAFVGKYSRMHSVASLDGDECVGLVRQRFESGPSEYYSCSTDAYSKTKEKRGRR